MEDKEDKDRIENYQFIKTIGKGTFGKVKLSIHLPTKEYVAIKILEKSKIQDKDELIRIEREIKYLKMLNHPNIIQIYEVIDNPKNFYIVMEYASGGELFNYINEHKRLTEEEASLFFTQLIYGVKEIHKKKICHRDIKPENLLISEKKIIKIIDFNLSKEYSDMLSSQTGSPCYAAPEVIKGMKYNGLMIDLWACGITLFGMICGYLPFDDKDNNIVFQKILECNIIFPDEKKIKVSSEAKDLICKILTPNPLKRIKIDEILNHPFLKSGIQEYKKIMKPILFNQDKVIIDYMVNKLKFSNKNQLISRLIKANKHNNYTTTYKLLKKKIIEGRLNYNFKKIYSNNNNKYITPIKFIQLNNKEKKNITINNYLFTKRNNQNIKANLRKNVNLNDISNITKRNRTMSKDSTRNSHFKNLMNSKKNKVLVDKDNNLTILKNKTLILKDSIKMKPVYQELNPKKKYLNNFIRCINTSMSVDKKLVTRHKKMLSKTPSRYTGNPFIYDQDTSHYNNKKIYFPNRLVNKRNVFSGDIMKQKTLKYEHSPLTKTKNLDGMKSIHLKFGRNLHNCELSPIKKNKYIRKYGLSADRTDKKLSKLNKNHILININKTNNNYSIKKRNNNNNIPIKNGDICSEQSTNITNITLTSPSNLSNNIIFKKMTFSNSNNNIGKSRACLNKQKTNSLIYNRFEEYKKIPYSNTIKKDYSAIKTNISQNKLTSNSNIMENNRYNHNTINTNIIYNNYINHRNKNHNNEIKEERTTKYIDVEDKINLRNRNNNKYLPISLKIKNSVNNINDYSTSQNKSKTINHTNEIIYYNKNSNCLSENIHNDNIFIIQQPHINNYLTKKVNINMKQIKSKVITFCNKYNYSFNNYKGWKYTIFIDNNNSFILEINSKINNTILKLYNNKGSELVIKENINKLLSEFRT